MDLSSNFNKNYRANESKQTQNYQIIIKSTYKDLKRFSLSIHYWNRNRNLRIYWSVWRKIIYNYLNREGYIFIINWINGSSLFLIVFLNIKIYNCVFSLLTHYSIESFQLHIIEFSYLRNIHYFKILCQIQIYYIKFSIFTLRTLFFLCKNYILIILFIIREKFESELSQESAFTNIYRIQDYGCILRKLQDISSTFCQKFCKIIFNLF